MYHLFSLTNCYRERIYFAVRGAKSMRQARTVLSHLSVTYRGKIDSTTTFDADIWSYRAI